MADPIQLAGEEDISELRCMFEIALRPMREQASRSANPSPSIELISLFVEMLLHKLEALRASNAYYIAANAALEAGRAKASA